MEFRQQSLMLTRVDARNDKFCAALHVRLCHTDRCASLKHRPFAKTREALDRALDRPSGLMKSGAPPFEKLL